MVGLGRVVGFPQASSGQRGDHRPEPCVLRSGHPEASGKMWFGAEQSHQGRCARGRGKGACCGFSRSWDKTHCQASGEEQGGPGLRAREEPRLSLSGSAGEPGCSCSPRGAGVRRHRVSESKWKHTPGVRSEAVQGLSGSVCSSPVLSTWADLSAHATRSNTRVHTSHRAGREASPGPCGLRGCSSCTGLGSGCSARGQL